jgi:hypothetical protein
MGGGQQGTVLWMFCKQFPGRDTLNMEWPVDVIRWARVESGQDDDRTKALDKCTRSILTASTLCRVFQGTGRIISSVFMSFLFSLQKIRDDEIHNVSLN